MERRIQYKKIFQKQVYHLQCNKNLQVYCVVFGTRQLTHNFCVNVQFGLRRTNHTLPTPNYVIGDTKYIVDYNRKSYQ